MVPADHFAATPSCGHWNFLMYVLRSVALCTVPSLLYSMADCEEAKLYKYDKPEGEFSFSDCAKGLTYLVALVPILVVT